MSDGLRSERWDNRWNWRMTFIFALAVLVLARFQLGQWWSDRTLVTGGGGPPAVLVRSSRHHQTLETWDWRTNRTTTIAMLEGHLNGPQILCTGDRKVVWFADGMLHTDDLEAPGQRRSWKTSLPKDESYRFAVVGTSADFRYVVVQYTPGYEVLVIDLRTGEEFSKKHWPNRLEATFAPGEFTSRHETWRLTDEGVWELSPGIADSPPHVDIAVDQGGNRRQLLGQGSYKNGELPEQLEVKAWMPSGQHLLLRRGGEVLMLAHVGRGEVQVLPISTYYAWASCFTTDGEQLLVTDVYGDVHVVDAASGEIVASSRSGAHWRWTVGGLSTACLCIAGLWGTFAFQQKEPLRAIVDLHVAAMAGQIALFSFLPALPMIWPGWIAPITDGTILSVTAAFGMAVGWYWMYGPASLRAKLQHGLLSILSIAVVPSIVMAGRAPSLATALVMPSFAGLFAACAMAMMLVPCSLTSWRASKEPLQSPLRRFGLAAMMLVIAGASVVLGFLNLIFMPSSRGVAADVAMTMLPVAVLGLLWPTIALMSIDRSWRIALGIGIAVWIVATMAARTVQLPVMASWYVDRAAYSFLATTAPLILGIAALARKHGWRWRRAVQPLATSEDQSLEAAA